jgi:hypothetical protein
VRLASILLLVLGLLPLGSRPAAAQFLGLTVSGSPATMTINSVTAAGQQPTPKVDASTTYKVLVFLAPAKKITARLNANMPAGVTLTAQLGAPGGATSNGAIALDVTSRDLVTNISNAFNSTQTITYTLSATVFAGVVPLQSRTVTLTLVNYP